MQTKRTFFTDYCLRLIGWPQQWSVPSPPLVTMNSEPQCLQMYRLPTMLAMTSDGTPLPLRLLYRASTTNDGYSVSNWAVRFVSDDAHPVPAQIEAPLESFPVLTRALLNNKLGQRSQDRSHSRRWPGWNMVVHPSSALLARHKPALPQDAQLPGHFVLGKPEGVHQLADAGPFPVAKEQTHDPEAPAVRKRREQPGSRIHHEQYMRDSAYGQPRETPSGVIDLANDILGVILQYLHNCN